MSAGHSNPARLSPYLYLVNTNTTPVLHQNAQGLAVVGYADAAISGFSVNVEGVSFTHSDIQDRVAVAGAPGAAVFFSQDLANGATPSISMFLKNDDGELEIGDVVCGLASGPPAAATRSSAFSKKKRIREPPSRAGFGCTLGGPHSISGSIAD
jgi:hypothetical protein